MSNENTMRERSRKPCSIPYAQNLNAIMVFEKPSKMLQTVKGLWHRRG